MEAPVAQTVVAIRSLRPPRPPRIWWIPVFITVFVVVVAVLVTAVIVANEAQVRRARREFAALKARAREAPPRQATEMYQQYIDTHPAGRLTIQAARERDQARADIDEWDWQQAQVAATEHGEDIAASRDAYESYLRLQPSGAYVDLAKRQIRRLNERAERRVFEEAAAEPDPDRRAKRLQEYVDSHPEGVHADAARGLLAQISDEREEKAFKEWMKSLDTLRKAGQLHDALRTADRAIDSCRSDSRRARLHELRMELRDAAARQALRALENMPVTRPRERDRAIAAARRILARFGDVPSASIAKPRLQALLEAISKARAADLSARLVGLTDPRLTLRTIRDFVVEAGSSADDPAMHTLLLEAFGAYYRLLILEAPLPALYELTLTDGSTIAGQVDEQPLAYKVILPSGQKRFVSLNEVRRIDPLPERSAAEELRRALDNRRLTAENAEEILSLAQSTGAVPQTDAAQAFLAVLDPVNEQARRHMQQAGWIGELGGWFPKDDVEPTLGGSWIRDEWCPPERLAWIHDRVQARQPDVISEAERLAKEKVKLANIEIFRMSMQVPLECTVSLREEPVLTVYTSSPDGMTVEMRYSFAIHVTPKQTISDQQIGALVAKRLAALESHAKLAATLKIERKALYEVGFGFTLAIRDGRWFVETVLPGSPAHNAGVEPGHAVTRIGPALLTDQLAEADVASLMAGAEGTSARIEFADGAESYDLDLVREPLVRWIEGHSVIMEHNLDGMDTPRTEPPKAL